MTKKYDNIYIHTISGKASSTNFRRCEVLQEKLLKILKIVDDIWPEDRPIMVSFDVC